MAGEIYPHTYSGLVLGVSNVGGRGNPNVPDSQAVSSRPDGASQPSPYPASLPRVRSITSEVGDTAGAFDALEAWIRRSPSERSVWTLDRTAGKWRVGLTTSSERLSAGVGDTLAAAARAALAIADAAGYL